MGRARQESKWVMRNAIPNKKVVLGEVGKIRVSAMGVPWSEQAELGVCVRSGDRECSRSGERACQIVHTQFYGTLAQLPALLEGSPT